MLETEKQNIQWTMAYLEKHLSDKILRDTLSIDGESEKWRSRTMWVLRGEPSDCAADCAACNARSTCIPGNLV